MATGGLGNIINMPKPTLVNLSTTFILTPDMKSLKNLSFCPIPHATDNKQIMGGIDKYLRRIRRTVFFITPPDPEEFTTNPLTSILASQNDASLSPQPFDHLEFRNPSKFDNSSEQNPALDTYCNTVKQRVYIYQGGKYRFNNLTPGECQALKDLANNPEIIIRPADKGCVIVVMDTSMYITEVKRQLSND